MPITIIAPPPNLTREELTEFQKAQEAYCATKKKAIWLLVGGPLVAGTCYLIFQETFLGKLLPMIGGVLSVMVAGLTLVMNKDDLNVARRNAQFYSALNRKHDEITTELFGTVTAEAHRKLIAHKKPYLKERNTALKAAAPVYQPPSRRVAGWGAFAGLAIGTALGASTSAALLASAAVTFSLWKAWEAHTTTKDAFDKEVKAHQNEIGEFRSELRSYRSNVSLYVHARTIERLDKEIKALSL